MSSVSSAPSPNDDVIGLTGTNVAIVYCIVLHYIVLRVSLLRPIYDYRKHDPDHWRGRVSAGGRRYRCSYHVDEEETR